MPRDEIYRENDKKGDFIFDERVSNVFPDMIQRSIPGYNELVRFSAVWAKKQFFRDGSVIIDAPIIIDLGASRGAVVFELLHHIGAASPTIYAVDNSKPMLSLLEEQIVDAGYIDRVVPVFADISDYAIPEHHLAIMHMTLQFIDPSKRLGVLEEIYKNQKSDAALLIAEKVRIDDSDHFSFTQLHEEFKRNMGYWDKEIDQKRKALENVMKIDSEATHLERFEKAGFTHVTKWFQCYNFVGWVVQK